MRSRTREWLPGVLLLAACGGAGTESSPPPPPPDEVIVSSVTPSHLTSGRTQPVVIRGSGFDAGSSVSFLVDGVETTDLAAGNIQFVSPTEIKANVSVGAGTIPRRYAVRIRTGRGTRGTGNEKITVILFELFGLGRAQGINSAGTIVGDVAATEGAIYQAYVQRVGEAPVLLPSLGGSNVSVAWDITENSLVVGQDGNSPVRWQGPAWTVERLVPSSNPPQWFSLDGGAQAANDAGVIVGWVKLNNGTYNNAFCWKQGAAKVVMPTDPAFPGTGVLWDVNENGEAAGRTVRLTSADNGNVEALVVHCHSENPSVTILPRSAEMSAAYAWAISDDGTVYGDAVVGTETRHVRWRMTSPDTWLAPEIMDIPFTVRGVTRGGRLVGTGPVQVAPGESMNAAWLWDPLVGVVRLTEPISDGASGALAAGDSPNQPVQVAGFSSGRAARWPAPIRP